MLVAGGVELVLVARDDHQVGTQAQQFGGDRAADAHARAGHQRHLPVQPPAVRVHCLLLVARA